MGPTLYVYTRAKFYLEILDVKVISDMPIFR